MVTFLVTDSFLQISPVQHGHVKITMLTHTSYLNGDKIFSRDQACIASNMQILYEFNIFIIQLFLQTNYHAFTISSVQDACLDYAEILGALQKF